MKTDLKLFLINGKCVTWEQGTNKWMCSQ